MDFKTCRHLIASDLRRLERHPSFLKGFKRMWSNPSFRITFWFRLGSWLKSKRNFLAKIPYGIVFMIHRHNQYKTGIQIPLGTQVGEGLRFFHFSCVVINPRSVIGDNCTIFHGVTLGTSRGEGAGFPVVGNNVVLSAGAKLIGGVNVGHHVMIGANAVVVKDIPDGAVAVGVPAKVVSQEGEKHVKEYVLGV